jgi:hypothetical protein
VELADAGGTLEVGEHQGVEELSAWSGAEGVQTLAESALEVIGSHGRRLCRPVVAPRFTMPVYVDSRALAHQSVRRSEVLRQEADHSNDHQRNTGNEEDGFRVT